MIVYALRCACGHEFNDWFDNMADYDARKAVGIPCPSCGGAQVAKAIMAPRVGKARPAPAPACAPACAPGGCGGGGCPMMELA